MAKKRIRTTESFKEVLPLTGDSTPVSMLDVGGSFIHLNLRLGNGDWCILSVPEATVNNRPEYFEYYEKQQ